MIRENDYGENYVNHPNIKAIHEHRGTGSTACFSFHSTSEAQVEKLLNELNVRKSPGHDMIPPRLIKESAAVVARPLTSIINYCIGHCCYPSSWKKGTVTPLFKKNDEHSKVNYRPVTVLPALNNIFERLLAGQLCEFYREILSDFISAYRKFHSCETSLLRLTEDWRMMRDRGISQKRLMLFSIYSSFPNSRPTVWTIQVALYSGTISLVDLRKLRLGIPSPTGKASDVGSRRGVC